MTTYKKQIARMVIAVLAITLFGSCKKFLDINSNPNIASDPGVQNVLPSAQVEIAHVLGNNLQV
ncbi:MAG TPA: SusD/RagB family nutrient-binding outer membrane lipoprotein, partial [Ferruginibacter sp.]|nr:SusD/RagB family nutrient-binding outer membrane lipoprotein [Ferruginibacter sp.]